MYDDNIYENDLYENDPYETDLTIRHTVPAPAHTWAALGARERERDEIVVRHALWMMPLLDVIALMATTRLGRHRAYRALSSLRRRGLVARASLGRTQGVCQRSWLTKQGVLATRYELGLPVPWQTTQIGLRWLVLRLPMVEQFYAVAPELMCHPDVLTPRQVYLTPDPDEAPVDFTDDLLMVKFQWIREGEIHAIVSYENGAWFPLIWVGCLVSGTVVRRKLAKARKQLDEDLLPAGWVVICEDGLAAHQSSDQWDGYEALVVVPGHPAVRQMRPSAFSHRRLVETAEPAALGSPESIGVWLMEDAAMLALNGRTAYYMFMDIAEWAGATARQLEIRWGPGYRAVLRPLRNSGLVIRLEGGHYLTRAGILAAAHMNRISWQSVRARLGVYLNEDGVYRRDQQRHNRSVIEVACELARRGYEVYGGWRALRNVPGVTQVDPDAFVLRGPDGQLREWFVEVELSARTPARIERKMQPYRLVHQHTGEQITSVWFVDTVPVRDRFRRMGAGLEMECFTLGEFLGD